MQQRPHRMGLLGGTFNPIHRGHLSICLSAYQQLSLQSVMVIPTGIPPHKRDETLADALDRLAMVRLAVQDYAFIQVLDMEINRPGVTYTIDTLQQLRQSMAQSAELIYLVGIDTLLDSLQWKQSEKVMELCSFAVMQRHGVMEGDFETMVARFESQSGKRAYRLEGIGPLISSEYIRSRIAKGLPVDEWLDEKVLGYIQEKELYCV